MIRRIGNTFLAFLLAALTAACSEDTSGDILAPSPTGTYLDPKDGLGEVGYEVRDEVCENTDAATYMKRFQTPMFRDVAVVEEVAYLVDGSMLWAVSIADPTAPKRLSLTRLPGTPVSVTALGTRLFIADGTSSVRVIDIADPAAPSIENSIENIPGAALDTTIVDNILFVAAGSGGLVAEDISDPTNPIRLGSISLVGLTNAVTVSDNIAYTASCGQVSLVDVADPTAPRLLRSVGIPEGHARDVAVEDGRLAVAAGEALFLVDARDPETAEVVSYYTDPSASGFYVNAVSLKDGIAFIAAGDESFRAIDIIRMTPIDRYESPADIAIDIDSPTLADPPGTVFIVLSDPIGIAIYDDTLFVLGNFRWVGERLLRLLDISDLSKPPVDIGRYAQPRTLPGVDTFDGDIYTHHADGRTIASDIDGNETEVIDFPAPVSKMSTRGEAPHMLLTNGDVFRRGDFGDFSKIGDNANDLAVSTQLAAISYPLYNSLKVEPSGEPFTTGSTSIELEDGFLGFSRLFAEANRIYAYDWALGRIHIIRRASNGALSYQNTVAVGECEGYDVADFYSGRDSDEARMQKADEGLALLCPYDPFGMSSILFFSLDDPDAPTLQDRWELPAGRYGDFQVEGGAVYTVGFDNNTYRSTLHRFSDSGDTSVEMDGGASGVAVVGDDIFVSDFDFGLRRFRFETDALVEVETPAAMGRLE